MQIKKNAITIFYWIIVVKKFYYLFPNERKNPVTVNFNYFRADINAPSSSHLADNSADTAAAGNRQQNHRFQNG